MNLLEGGTIKLSTLENAIRIHWLGITSDDTRVERQTSTASTHSRRLKTGTEAKLLDALKNEVASWTIVRATSFSAQVAAILRASKLVNAEIDEKKWHARDKNQQVAQGAHRVYSLVLSTASRSLGASLAAAMREPSPPFQPMLGLTK